MATAIGASMSHLTDAYLPPEMSTPAPTASEEKVVVGIGELAVTDNPEATLITYSLGSCLGITLYDPYIRVGGLWHVMLPDSSIDPVKGMERPGMFIDTGWPAFLRLAGEMGAELNRVELFVAGGAQVMDPDGVFGIGRSNCVALRKLIREAELTVIGEEIGGVENRTVHLHIGDGRLRIKASGRAEEIIL